MENWDPSRSALMIMRMTYDPCQVNASIVDNGEIVSSFNDYIGSGGICYHTCFQEVLLFFSKAARTWWNTPVLGANPHDRLRALTLDRMRSLVGRHLSIDVGKAC